MERELKQKIDGVLVFKDLHAFRRYRISVIDSIENYRTIYQNNPPTIQELRAYKSQYYNHKCN